MQPKQVCRHLQQRPITLWYSGYGCVTFVKETANINVDKLIRLRPNRCIYAEPPQYQGNGRPKKHGQKMKLSAPETWAVPVESIEIDHTTWGVVKISLGEFFSFLNWRFKTLCP